MRKSLEERMEAALKFMESLKFEEQELGKHVVDDDFYYLVQTYESKLPEEARYEAHERYIDIQYVVEGKERIDISPASVLEVEEPYSEEKDVMFFKAPQRAASVVLTDGGYVILYPEDAHRPGVCAGQPMAMKKIVGKVRI